MSDSMPHPDRVGCVFDAPRRGRGSMAEPVSEERQKAYFERARKGVLTWLSKREGASATLAEMHDHSAERFLIAHQGFSKMMESFVDGGLVDYDVDTRTATLTAAGRQFIDPAQ